MNDSQYTYPQFLSEVTLITLGEAARTVAETVFSDVTSVLSIISCTDISRALQQITNVSDYVVLIADSGSVADTEALITLCAHLRNNTTRLLTTILLMPAGSSSCDTSVTAPLLEKCHSVITFGGQGVDSTAAATECLTALLSECMLQGETGFTQIADTLSTPGFARIVTTTATGGYERLAVGLANLLRSPLLDGCSPLMASNCCLFVSSDPDASNPLTMQELSFLNEFQASLPQGSRLLWTYNINPALDDLVRLTIIFTGLNNNFRN